MEDEEWNWDEKSGKSTADLKLKFPVSTINKYENSLNELLDDAPTRGTRLLTDIYARCNIVVCEPADFFTAIKDIKWVAAMKEELFMIEKNKTWELSAQSKTCGQRLCTIFWRRLFRHLRTSCSFGHHKTFNYYSNSNELESVLA